MSRQCTSWVNLPYHCELRCDRLEGHTGSHHNKYLEKTTDSLGSHVIVCGKLEWHEIDGQPTDAGKEQGE